MAPARPESVRSAAQRTVPPLRKPGESEQSHGRRRRARTAAQRERVAARSRIARAPRRGRTRRCARRARTRAFDPATYADLAWYSADGQPPPPPPAEEHMEGYFDHVPPSRAQSVNSGLSYVSDPNQ